MKRIAVMLCSVAMLVGCASEPAPSLTSDAVEQSLPAPPPDKAQIIFLQPFKPIGGLVQPTWLFEVKDSGREMMDVVTSKGKAVELVAPGEHTFMSMGIGSSVMKANVEPGKRYYVLSRFIAYVGYQLRPIRRQGPSDYNATIPQFQEWLRDCAVVKTTPDGTAWVANHQDTVNKMLENAWASWQRKSAEEKAELTLDPGDDIAQ